MEKINFLLAQLPTADRDAVLGQSRTFHVGAGQLLRDRGDEIVETHLPSGGVLAALTVLEDGRALETGLISREGAIPSFLEPRRRASRRRLLALTDVSGHAINVEKLHSLASARPTIRAAFDTLGADVARCAEQASACAAHHDARERLARLLLRLFDLGSDEPIRLTQTQVAMLLGVQRTSVNEAARSLQAAGAIRYARGQIKMADRLRLTALSCGCYEPRPVISNDRTFRS